MKRFFVILTICVLLTSSGTALAEDKTITLPVENMTCTLCPLTVRRALKAVGGVHEAHVSLETEKAVVSFDDESVDVETLITATTNAGFPSTLNREDQSDDDEDVRL
ncbi:cation transporter [Candidatus Nitronereus thalassa]|uniref:Cation transporter n=1 Tax=Candidatus Nitronereus thalassa TaxID=3020898 RepID=A0ABU3K310_9BACT|nr:cation transporter [Candidatus Nitronereus thalassa]MDT7040780.1 cation transporter [Candidatus Nitronereus thalassa]